MELAQLQELLSRIKGCTFASLDAETVPKPGIHKIVTGERVMLFTNKQTSGYENMVRRKLIQAGKNPDNFVLSELPWGERVPGTPLIYHEGRHYLQTILLAPGEANYFIGRHKVNPEDVGIKERRTNQGLPKGNEVLVSTYALDSITRIVLMGTELTGQAKRKVLKIKH